MTGLTESVRTSMGLTGRARLAIYDAQVRAGVPTSAIKSLEDFNLKPRSVELLADRAPHISLSMPAAEPMDIQHRVMTFELGARKGRRAADAVEGVFGGWKRSADSRDGRFLRWAAAEMDGNGDDAFRFIEKFNEALVTAGIITRQQHHGQMDQLVADTGSRRANSLVQGLIAARKANHMLSWLQQRGEEEVTVYRGWRLDQLPT